MVESDKIKVSYFIFSSHPQSGGGHFHSLKTIVEGLARAVNYQVLNAGLVLGQPLHGFPNTTFISMKRWSFQKGLILLFRQVKEFDPDVLHAFDLKSLWLARTLGYWLGKPVIFTKCGGANGSEFIPAADAYVFFSGENLKHYQKHQTVGGGMHLIPNRASRKEQDVQRISTLREATKLMGKFVILRISRVNPYYHRTYQQAIALLKVKLKIQPNTVLLFIGFIQDQGFFEQLQQEAEGLPVHFVTEPEYCRAASELIGLADACVATGRGVMEAASVGVPIYCPVADAELPVPLNLESLPQLLHFNFSERAQKIPKQQEETLSIDRQKAIVEKIYQQYFSVNVAVPKHLELYKDTQQWKASFINYLSHGLRFVKGLR
jgi:hypothetical protein